jgi:hypothetical protein
MSLERSLQEILRRARHEKAIFDRSDLRGFVPFREENDREWQKVIITDLGYVAIMRVLANAGGLQKHPWDCTLREAQMDGN